MDDDIDVDHEFESFQRACWKLERLARKHQGYIKLVPTKATRLKAYAARMFRRLSRLGWDIPDLQPPPGWVCAFSVEQFNRKCPLWDIYGAVKLSKGRIRLTVVTGDAYAEQIGQTFILNAVEVA